jgi:prepilin-type N-terminal cleavage/methylation domain-containing protein
MRERGFSLVELLMVVVVFTVITGAVFTMLNAAQQRYRMEAAVLEAFQDARLGLEQVARDIHSAGYPPANAYEDPGATPANLIAMPFAWSPGYPNAACMVNATCAVPGPFDLVIESDIDPQNNNGVEWVRYRLDGTTLERGVASKVAGGDPLAATEGVMLPYIENVMNNAGADLMNRIRESHPDMFPGNQPVPVFTYPDLDGTAVYSVRELREVQISLIVRAPGVDPRTGQLRVVNLTGLARRLNPVE